MRSTRPAARRPREALQRFDTDGARLELGGQLWFSKGRQPKYYQTPYGEVEIERHVYQRSHGGKTFCPLERDGRIVGDVDTGVSRR